MNDGAGWGDLEVVVEEVGWEVAPLRMCDICITAFLIVLPHASVGRTSRTK